MGRKSDAKERLIQAASELIHERGYTAVGISDICKAANVQKGSFYYFFPSKVELALAVIDHFTDQDVTENEAMLTGEGSPLQRLKGRINTFIQEQAQVKANTGQVRGCPLGNLVLEMSTQEPVIRDHLKSSVQASLSGFQDLLQEAINKGEIPPQDVEQSAFAIEAILEGSMLLAKVHNDLSRLDHVVDTVFHLIGANQPETP